MDCGGKRSATPLWIGDRPAKALSPLRTASAVQNLELPRYPWLGQGEAPAEP